MNNSKGMNSPMGSLPPAATALPIIAFEPINATNLALFSADIQFLHLIVLIPFQ